MASAAQQAAITTRHKYEQRCPDCGSSDFVDDFSAGDLICRVRAAQVLQRPKPWAVQNPEMQWPGPCPAEQLGARCP